MSELLKRDGYKEVIAVDDDFGIAVTVDEVKARSADIGYTIRVIADFAHSNDVYPKSIRFYTDKKLALKAFKVLTTA